MNTNHILKLENTMHKKVLVAYASKYGGTAEIAEKIGQVLRQADVHTDIQPANQVNDLCSYQGVVLGSAVYLGNWRQEAVKFMQTNEELLAERPLWLFSSGPTGIENRAAFINGENVPKRLQPIINRIQPRGTTIFQGRINWENLDPLERWMIRKTASTCGDFRNWEAIISWAATIADTLN